MRILMLIAILMLAGPATAGAWLRAEGTGFLAYGSIYSEDGTLDGNLYGEYGVRPKLTLGIKLDADMTAGRMGNGSGFVFVRKPIPLKGRPFHLAYEVGIGSTFGDHSDALLLTGLSYGRGITIAGRSGWLAIDGSVEWSLGDSTDTGKLDTTIGLNLNDRVKVMAQVFHSQTETASSTTLAPSLVWQPKADKPSYQLGLEAKEGTIAIKLGLWRTF